MDVSRFANLIDVPQLRQLAAGDTLRNPYGLLGALILVMLVLYGLSVGKTRALVSLLAIYIAYALTILFPFLSAVRNILPDQLQPVTAVVLFFVLYGITFMILSYSMLHARLTLGEISFFQVMIISIVQIGLLTSMGCSLLSPEISQRFLGSLVPYMASQRALWLWAAVSLAIVPLMKARFRE